MANISSLSGYGNQYSLYTQGTSSANTDEMQAFDMMRQMQMSMVDALSGDYDSSSSSSQTNNESDIGDIFMSDFNAQLNKIMMQLQTKSNANFDKDVDAVSDALNSGDLAGAKAAFASLESKANKPEPMGSDTQKGKDFASLKSALEAGDIKGSKEALTTISQHSMQARIESFQNTNLNAMTQSLQNSYANSSMATNSLSPLLSSFA
jgi:hypothetical protein